MPLQLVVLAAWCAAGACPDRRACTHLTTHACAAPRPPHLCRCQVSGAPVVTDEGELIANLSISDIRWVTLNPLSRLP